MEESEEDIAKIRDAWICYAWFTEAGITDTL